MEFDAKSLFSRTNALWPEKLDLGGAVFAGRSVEGLQVLNEVYHELEVTVDTQDDWLQLSIWAFHQALWAKAVECLAKAEEIICVADVTFDVFDDRMKKNLEDPSWSAERAIYLQDRSRQM